MRAASDGVSPGNAGQGCNGNERLYLLVAMVPARHRLALFARPAPPAYGLDRMVPARQGLAMQLRRMCLAARKHFYASTR